MATSPNPVRFRSKVDWWLGLIILAVPAISLVMAVMLQLGGRPGEAIVGWAVLAPVLVLYAVVVWPVEYILEADVLVIRFGVMRPRVPYRTIRGVTPSRGLLASPALSLDRLAIDTGRALPVTISPADRTTFLDALAPRAPHLERDGDRLLAL